MRGRNFTKPFSLIGAFLGELYMLSIVLAPHRTGLPSKILLSLPPESPQIAELSTPVGIVIFKVLAYATLFGVFGALAGLGVGLLVTGLFAKRAP